MNGLHPCLGARQFFQRGSDLIRRKSELRGKPSIFGVKFLAGQNADAQPPVPFFCLRQQGVQFGGRIQVHRQLALVEVRQPVVFGRAVDEDVFRSEPFGERGPQFQFADNFNGAPLGSPPAEQRPDRLGLEREPVAEKNGWFTFGQLLRKTGGDQSPVHFGNPFCNGFAGENVERRRGKGKRLANEALPELEGFGRMSEIESGGFFRCGAHIPMI